MAGVRWPGDLWVGRLGKPHCLRGGVCGVYGFESIRKVLYVIIVVLFVLFIMCLVWLPGRPGKAWLEAMHWLLAQAPATATISCDPDPAGIQIAVTAGRLWDDAGVAWQAAHMDISYWQSGKTLPLTDYDHRVLAELQVCDGLSPALASLRDYISLSGTKAEQEGWL